MKKLIFIFFILFLIGFFSLFGYKEYFSVYYHNKGNIIYNNFKDIKDLEESINYYNASIGFNKNQKTNKNLEFVLNEMKNLSKKQEFDSQTNSGSNKSSNEQKNSSGSQNNNISSGSSNLSEYSEKQLENRIEELKSFHGTLSKYYNTFSDNNIEDIFNRYTENFFNHNKKEKDW